MKTNLLISGFAIWLVSCTTRPKIDLLVYNATVYTVDSSFSIAQAIAVKDGMIVALGTTDSLRRAFDATEQVDAQGKFIYPGFIDAHAHFFSYGLALKTADLTGTKSWDEVIERINTFAAENNHGWLTGRGWDQNDWAEKSFPSKEKLDELFPDRPVFLTRVDGHAAIANQVALDSGGIQVGGKLLGGEVQMRNGLLTGVLIDNAVDLVSSHIPAPTGEEVKNALLRAQKNCFAVGLTTIDDCGLDYMKVLLMDSLQKAGELKMRIYAMLSDAKRNFDFLFRKGKIKTPRMNVRSFKVYADGALGSRGACLIEPYSDEPGHYGFLLSNASHFDSVAKVIYEKGFQMCTHAIGDSANRFILDIYAKYLKGKNDFRWRIEHAQVINKNDFSAFGACAIIPSVQPTHATSDMYWAGDRLGSERERGAYAFKQLLEENGWIPLGTDFPVEDISPIKTFYAAAIRKDSKGFPASGYQTENALTRKQALQGMTAWAAKSNFEENEKGTLEKGKVADFIILDQDLLRAADTVLLETQVLRTYLNGELVFEKR